jgi:hypothetical protein
MLALAKYLQAISAKAACFSANIPLAEANGNDFCADIKLYQSKFKQLLIVLRYNH